MKKKEDHLLKKHSQEQINEALNKILDARMKPVLKDIESLNKKFAQLIKQHEKDLKKKK